MRISRRALLRRLGGVAGVAPALALIDGAVGAAIAEPTSCHHEHGGRIRLSLNENAYGPSPRAMKAMRDSVDLVHRYPDSEQTLVAEIAALHRVTPAHIVLGCGSSGILGAAATTFLAPGKRLVLASPTFEVIAECAHRVGADVAAVPLDGEYAHDVDAMLARAGTSAAVVYVCNPNNPTGTLTPRADLETFIRQLPATTRVVIDEAYHDYATASAAYVSFIDRPVDDDRIIVTRSLSKVYGLAGLRLGYAIAAPSVARQLSGCRLPMEINVAALHAGLAALADREHVRLSVRTNANDRQEFYNQATTRMLRVIDSHANFFMLKPRAPAAVVVEHLKHHDILVPPPIRSTERAIRVSLGTPAEMREFWRVWDLMAPHGAHM